MSLNRIREIYIPALKEALNEMFLWKTRAARWKAAAKKYKAKSGRMGVVIGECPDCENDEYNQEGMGFNYWAYGDHMKDWFEYYVKPLLKKSTK